ncbi:MAG: hypothetical protein V1752_04150 [Candidatus Firestonebacteria bacterium]
MIIVLNKDIDSLPKSYRDRVCSGKAWKMRFPEINKSVIQHYLQIYIESFDFKDKYRLIFKPDEKINDVYIARYSETWIKGVDDLELGRFLIGIENEYNIELPDYITGKEDLTLGELFEYVIKNSKVVSEC